MRLPALFAALLLSACAPHAPPTTTAPPLAAAATTGQAMVAAANPLAVEAGLEVLRQGGSAVDAAVAVQTVLGLVEPQSSGLGGGAFLLVYDPRTNAVTAYDGRETAPGGADERLFLGPNDKPLTYAEAVVSGRATGAPGVVAMLGAAHKAHGRRPWPSLFATAAKLADDGFVVSPRLAGYIASDAFPQRKQPDVQAYFTGADGASLKAGDRLKNPAYAATLRRIAAEGARAMYEGPVADAIVTRVKASPLPGTLTAKDLAGYEPNVGPALCRPYRVHVVCSAQAPSGGPALLQLLAILEPTDIADRGPADPQAWFLFAEASRLMYADRDRYLGDPAFAAVPVEGLLDPAYTRARSALIGARAGPPPEPGAPDGVIRAPDRTREAAGTSHFTIIDARGQVVSMTTTVESLFGTGRMAAGFFLNNQLTDFAFQPREVNGVLAANAPAAGKRPRSSMAPAIVLDRQGRFVAAVGSPGGSAILAYNAKALVGWMDWGLTMQQAIDLPNLIARGDAFYGDADKFPAGVAAGLGARGISLKPGRGENSGLHGVAVREGRLEGGADPRREGVARTP